MFNDFYFFLIKINFIPPNQTTTIGLTFSSIGALQHFNKFAPHLIIKRLILNRDNIFMYASDNHSLFGPEFRTKEQPKILQTFMQFNHIPISHNYKLLYLHVYIEVIQVLIFYIKTSDHHQDFRQLGERHP